jgi:DNA-binding NarL/FixJ family response regulator
MPKTKVILADDHAVVRAGIGNAIKDMLDIEIIGEVGNGDDLAAMLEENPPDCLLIDVTMPNFDPLSAIGAIRVRYPEMKILVVSAYDDDVYVQGLLGIGVNGYHLKDQPLSDLRLAIQRIIAGERWISSRIVDRLIHYNENLSAEHNELSARQRDMLRLLYKGLDNRNIALQLGLSVKTVENHLTRLYKILNVHSRLEAMNYLMQHPEVLASDITTPPTVNVSRPTNRSKQSILLVDDNERYRHQLIRALHGISPQIQVFEAENIQQAIYFAQSIRPRLALVDVVLGNENGIHCVQQLTKITPQSRIILFSAYPDSEFHRLGLEAGAIAFLDKKNLDSAALRQILEDVEIL